MNWSLIFKCLFVGCTVLSFCMNILIMIYLFLRSKSRRNEIIKTILDSTRVENHIKESIRTSLSNSKTSLSPQQIDEIKKDIIDEIRHLQHLDEQESLSTAPIQQTIQAVARPANIEKKKYYATAVDGDSKTFCSVTSTPIHGETVFLLTEIQTNRCEFEVYEGAQSLVLSEKEYLIGACSLDKTGNSKIITVQKGVTERTTDGKWTVREQAKVKIE